MQIFRKYSFNEKTLTYELEAVPAWRIVLKRIAAVVVMVLLVMLYSWIYFDVLGLEMPKTFLLRKQNEAWMVKMDILNRQMHVYEETLSELEGRDEGVYRAIFGLDAIPASKRNAGLGGATRYDALLQSGASPLLVSYMRRGDAALKKTSVQSRSLDEIDLLSSQSGDMYSCIPAVPPISPAKGTYHISSPFGRRIDPVHGGSRFHEGIDLASDRGNPVYTTGDGVVEEVKFQFYGYGNEVIIDHGYGYKTRYAHLNAIFVAEGMKVNRGDQIGEVGNSGKSTGPHLHYEVIYKDSRVNPYNYFDMSMPEEEFRAMVDKRKEESPIGKRQTSGDVIRRLKK